MATIEDLPLELMGEIISYLDFNQVATLRQVNHRLNQIALGEMIRLSNCDRVRNEDGYIGSGGFILDAVAKASRRGNNVARHILCNCSRFRMNQYASLRDNPTPTIKTLYFKPAKRERRRVLRRIVSIMDPSTIEVLYVRFPKLGSLEMPIRTIRLESSKFMHLKTLELTGEHYSGEMNQLLRCTKELETLIISNWKEFHHAIVKVQLPKLRLLRTSSSLSLDGKNLCYVAPNLRMYIYDYVFRPVEYHRTTGMFTHLDTLTTEYDRLVAMLKFIDASTRNYFYIMCSDASWARLEDNYKLSMSNYYPEYNKGHLLRDTGINDPKFEKGNLIRYWPSDRRLAPIEVCRAYKKL